MEKHKNKRPLAAALLAGASAFTILVAGIAVDSHTLPGFGIDAAYAQQGGGGGGGSDGGGGGGGESGGGSGGGSGGHDAGSPDAGGSSGQSGRPATAGQGSESKSPQSGRPPEAGEDSDGKGPQAGQGGQGDSGGKPGWAQEGIPEVELGRLSVARSPEKVLSAALAEALANWDPATASLYNMSAEAFSNYVAANWDSITVVDSPLQNLALLEALYDGTLNLSSLGINPASTTDLAAIFLGIASDKTVAISTDTVIALNVIMDLGLDSGEIENLATKAEDVREGVLEGHG